jgi:hypothetical protein
LAVIFPGSQALWRSSFGQHLQHDHGVDLVGVQLGRQAVEVQSQLGQVAGIVGQGALAPAGDGDFLAELLVKFTESCYISTGSLEDGLLFFFILRRG